MASFHLAFHLQGRRDEQCGALTVLQRSSELFKWVSLDDFAAGFISVVKASAWTLTSSLVPAKRLQSRGDESYTGHRNMKHRMLSRDAQPTGGEPTERRHMKRFDMTDTPRPSQSHEVGSPTLFTCPTI